jgi:hypothetical protein
MIDQGEPPTEGGPPAANRARTAAQSPEESQKPWEVSHRSISSPSSSETLTGQTSWSRALVRHGADPGLALAEVLGVSAEDIRVRDPARGGITSRG